MSVNVLKLPNAMLVALLLCFLCYANLGKADNYGDLMNAAHRGDLKELGRIDAIAYEFSIDDTHLAALPAKIEEAIRHSDGFLENACRLVGKPINLILTSDGSGYAATTAENCNWKPGASNAGTGPVGPIWVVRNGDHPVRVFAGKGRMLVLSRTLSQSGLPNISIASGVPGRFTENSWKYDGKTYTPIIECGEDNVSSYCRSQQQTAAMNSDEEELNQAYKSLQKAISSPPYSAPKSTINALTVAERNWIKQRELDCTAEYVLLNVPKEEKRQNFECLSRLAEQRTKYLNEIRDCIVRGDHEHCPSY